LAAVACHFRRTLAFSKYTSLDICSLGMIVILGTRGAVHGRE
jgi:hypothetical protein